MRSVWRPLRLGWAGLAAGPLAWAASFEGNYLLVDLRCAAAPFGVPVAALALATLSLFGGYLSWRSRPQGGEGHGEERAVDFIARIGALMGVLFALGILLQGYAGLVFDGCER